MSIDQVKELNNKYVNTYVGLRGNDEVTPYYIEEFFWKNKVIYCKGFEAAQAYGTGTTSKTWAPKLIVFTDESAFVPLPKPGLRNYKDTVIYFPRYAARQWKKGICKENSGGYVILGSIYENIAVSPPSIENPEFYYSIFNPRYPSLKEATETLHNGDKIAVALSEKYFAYMFIHSPNILIGYKTVYPVGEVIGSSRVKLLPEFTHLFEDMLQIFPVST